MNWIILACAMIVAASVFVILIVVLLNTRRERQERQDEMIRTIRNRESTIHTRRYK